MAATIKDVARLAGVSPSTVSRVLNQKGVISDETKQKIASAMEQLKYVPNDIARSFANGSAHAISLVIDISDGTAYANNFFNNTVFGIETAAHQNDYNLIITNGAAAFGGISSVERLIAGKKVDGVVLPISPLTAKVPADLDFGLSLGVDWVALSFVQRAEDIREARAIIGELSLIHLRRCRRHAASTTSGPP